MKVRAMIEIHFEQLKEDCLKLNVSISGYTMEDAFSDSIIQILIEDKELGSYEELKEYISKKMSMIKYYKEKSMYSKKKKLYNGIYREEKENQKDY